MRNKARIKVKGKLKLRVYKHGVLIEESVTHNLVVNGGLNAIAKLLADDATGKPIKKCGVGTSNAAEAGGDTALAGAFTKNIAGANVTGTGVLQIDFTIEDTEANGMTIVEFGLFDTDLLLLNRIVKSPIVKDNTIRIVGEWEITIINS